MPRDAKDVAAGLQRKGFLAREGNHTFFHLYVGGKKTIISTKISHGEREIGDRLLGMMARQVGLGKRDFIDLVDCPLALEEYLAILRQGKRIE